MQKHLKCDQAIRTFNLTKEKRTLTAVQTAACAGILNEIKDFSYFWKKSVPLKLHIN